MSKITTTFLDGTTLWASSLNAIIEAINDNNDRIAALEALHNGDVTPTPEVTYTLTISVNDSTFGSVQGAGTYKEGQTVFITAIPNLGYKFSSWNDGVTTAVRTVIMSSNITLSATFESTTVQNDQLDIENDAVKNYRLGAKTMSESSNLLQYFKGKRGKNLPYGEDETLRLDWCKEVIVNGKSYWNLIPTTQILGGKSVRITGQVRMFKMIGTDNFRDLGGWSSSLGNSVKYGYLIRGAELSTTREFTQVATEHGHLYTYSTGSGVNDYYYSYTNHAATTADLETLVNAGVACELDLRGIDRTENDNTFSGYGIDYSLISLRLYSEANRNNYLTSTADGMNAWGICFNKIYTHAMNNEATYFHCTWGADRTGALAMMLLALLGVSEADIKKDYELTSLGSKAKGASDLSRLFWVLKQMGTGNLQKNAYKWWHNVCGVNTGNLDNFIYKLTGVSYDSSWLDNQIEPDDKDEVILSAGSLQSGCDGYIPFEPTELNADGTPKDCRVSQDGSKNNYASSGSFICYKLLEKFDVSAYSKITFYTTNSLVGACYDSSGTPLAENGKFLYYKHVQEKATTEASDGIIVDVPLSGMKYVSGNNVTTTLTKNTKYIAFNVYTGTGDTTADKSLTETQRNANLAAWRIKLTK